MSIQGLDSYLTSSPYDDEPDWVELAEEWMRLYPEPETKKAPDEFYIIQGLLNYIDENV